MRLALFGATGRIGGLLLARVVADGHQVTALARNPEALTASAAITAVTGDATDPAAVKKVITGCDAVLVALGPRGAKAPALLSTAAANITAAMAASGTRRLVAVSAAGAFVQGDPDMNVIIKTILPRVLAKPFADVRGMEEVVRASSLEWTLVRATQLTSGPLTGKYRVRPDYAPAGGRKISRADVAHFMCAALDDENWLKSAPALAY